MTENEIKLFLYSTNAEEIAVIKSKLHHSQSIFAVVGRGPQVTQAHRLDALWLTPMQATYYGLTGTLAPHVAQIFPMPDEKRELGLPRFVIAGVMLDPLKTYSTGVLQDLVPHALKSAVDAWNEWNPLKIIRIGSLPRNILDQEHVVSSLAALERIFSVSASSRVALARIEKVSA